MSDGDVIYVADNNDGDNDIGDNRDDDDVVMMMSTIWQIWPGLYPQGHGGASKELSRPPDWSSPNHINLITRDWSLPTIMISYFVCVLC